MKKVLVICPHFPPDKDGLAGYTDKYSRELSKHFEVHVLASSHADRQREEILPSGVTVHRKVESWSLGQVFETLDLVRAIDPDEVNIQYLPFLYARRGGVNFGIVWLAILIKQFLGKPFVVVYHELHYPFSFHPKYLLMSLLQVLMLLGVGLFANKIHAATSWYATLLKRYFFFSPNKVFYCPVGSNIDRIPLANKSELREKYGLKENEIILSCFGMFHVSKRVPLIIDVLGKLYKRRDLHFKLLFIGPSRDQFAKFLKTPNLKEDYPFLIPTGALEDNDVSLHLQLSEIFIGLYDDGASGRRGSLIAALQHGLPLITTVSDKTEKGLFEHPNIYSLSLGANFEERFEKLLFDLLNSPPSPSSQLQTHHDMFFSWAEIVRRHYQI